MNNQLDSLTVWCLSLTHGLIDLASALVVYNAAIIHGLHPDKAVAITITYDLLAFALQPLAGFVIDYVIKTRIAMFAGIICTLTGVVCMPRSALTGVLFAGIGNGLYHVGAGAQILGRYHNTTRTIGIFTGPGALGLSIGFWFGSQGAYPFWPLVIGLVVAGSGLGFLPVLMADSVRNGSLVYQVRSQPRVVLLLFFAILVRGFVGKSGFAGLHPDAFLIIGLGAAACIGKMAGGYIADWFGWGRTTIIALLFATIGVAFLHVNWVITFALMILFQMSMPITLAATSAALPGRPAFAFGLTCLALVSGTLPAFFIPQGQTSLPFTLVLIGISGICIIIALQQLERRGV